MLISKFTVVAYIEDGAKELYFLCGSGLRFLLTACKELYPLLRALIVTECINNIYLLFALK
jgi:hypothetical protein